MPKAFDARRRAMPGTDPNREGATVQYVVIVGTLKLSMISMT
jgi:hypothetical protein